MSDTTQADLNKKAANLVAHVQKMTKAHDDFHAAQASFHDGLSKLHKGTADYHEKMSKLHKARHAEATDHLTTLKKLLGSEEADSFGANAPKSVDIMSMGTEGAYKAAAPVDMASLVVQITEGVVAKVTALIPKTDDILQTVLGCMLGEEGVEKALGTANGPAATAGVGDRNQTQVIKTDLRLGQIPINKAEDTSTGAGAGASAVVDPAVDMKKVEQGDVSEALRFMKGVKVTGEIPSTLSAQFGSITGAR